MNCSVYPRRGAAALLLAVLAALSLLVAGGCSNSSPTGPSEDLLIISTLTPPAGTKLAPGSNVTFSSLIDFSLNSAGSATVVLMIEDQNNRLLNPNNEVTSLVPGGQGSVQLSAPFTVPATGVSTVKLMFVMTPNIGVPTPTTASASYPVG